MLKFGQKMGFTFVILMVLITDLAILLNIPYLRQILGFLFLTILPGSLILQVLKLNKIGYTEKFVLSVGLSISFVIFGGLMINYLTPLFGYFTPLASISLLISFNIAFIILAIIGYKTNKDVALTLPDLNLNFSEKVFLIPPIVFPALSIFGMYVLNTTDNNIILMFLLFLIPIYVVFVCFFNQRFPNRLYPVVIFSISISLLLLLSLRSNYILGMDMHSEYRIFTNVSNNLLWHAHILNNPLDVCISISILPTCYLSILNSAPQMLYKTLYVLIYSASPLVIYALSKKYIGDFYGFLASCFFMFQSCFLNAAANPRTIIAIFFFALAMMALFNDNINQIKKRFLLIVFTASCILSHYTTAYIFFVIMLGTLLTMELFSKRYKLKKLVTLTFVVLFFAFIFLWYSQVTDAAFSPSIHFIERTIVNLNELFIEESRGGGVPEMMGKEITQKGIPHKIEFVFTWLSFAFIAIGVITLVLRYRRMSFPELKFKKPDFLKDKFEENYFIISLECVGLLVAMIALPFLSHGYNLNRAYALAIVILSPFFVIGGIQLSKIRFLVIGTSRNESIKRNSSLRNCKRDSSNVMAYLIILLVLIPYFFSVTGVTYNIYGVPRAIILNSEGEQYRILYTHDQDTYGAKWLGKNYNVEQRLYSMDHRGLQTLISQSSIDPTKRIYVSDKNINIVGYIYLSYQNVIDGVTVNFHNIEDMDEYSICFVNTNKIYANGASEIYNRF